MARNVKWQSYVKKYHHASNVSHTLVGNKVVDHSDVVEHRLSNYIFILDFNGLDTDTCEPRWETFNFWDLATYNRELTVVSLIFFLFLVITISTCCY